MKYVEIDKIKAEIERLKSVLADPICGCLTSDYKAGGKKIADTLLSFINTLEQDAQKSRDIEENDEGLWYSD